MPVFPNKIKIDNSFLYSFLFRIYNRIKYVIISDVKYARIYYFKTYNKNLDLNNPKGFNEKLQWLKLYDRRPIHTLCADKLKVRDFIKKTIGEQYLIPLVKVLTSPKEIKADNLPNDYPVILKCNHNSSAYTIIHNKRKVNWKKQRRKFSNLLKQNYYYQSREWQYRDIKPKIIIEKLLIDKQGNIPPDYKIFCFHGIPKYIQLDLDRQHKHLRNFYDLDWNLLDMKLIYENGPNIKKPKQLTEMLSLAKTLSKKFPFARIDFYVFEEKIYFGEITFHPESGFGIFNDEKSEYELGSLIKL